MKISNFKFQINKRLRKVFSKVVQSIFISILIFLVCLVNGPSPVFADSISDSYADTTKINTGASSGYTVSGGQLKIGAMDATGGTITHSGGNTIHTFTTALTGNEFYGTSLLTDANIQGYYRLESNLSDSTTNARTLTGNGSTAYTTGKFGNAYTQSNNKVNYLNVANSMGVDGGNMSMGVWFKDVGTENAGTERGIMSQVNITSKTRFGIRRLGTNLVFGRDGVGGGGTAGAVTVDWSTNVSQANYNLLVLTYDGTNVRGYVNGVLVGTVAASGNGTGYAGAVTGFGIGSFQGWAGWDTTYNGNGLYDDPFIFNRVLTPTEISTIYSNFTFTTSSPLNVEVLVTAGGGGGGMGEGNLAGDGAGGGGAGGIVYNASYAVTAGAKTVTVGNYGSGSALTTSKGGTGGSSVFDTLTAYGGGGGGSEGTAAGANGGSGGGAHNSYESGATGGTATPGGQGNNGGNTSANYTTQRGGSGGGGASAVGTTRTSAAGGAGGAGTSYSTSGSPVTYGGGGGGGSSNNAAGGSATDGGGAGGQNGNGSAGTVNTGGGGGGGGAKATTGGYGGNGGTGVVIIRYPTSTGTSATIVSTNLLTGQTGVDGIDEFTYNLSSLPAATTATLWVGQDGSHWHSIQNGVDVQDGAGFTLSQGTNTIAIHSLLWSGSNFYYKVVFTSNGSATPTLDDITLNYTTTGSTTYGGSTWPLCAPLPGKDWVINNNCYFLKTGNNLPNKNIDGVDNGNLTVSAYKALTVKGDQILARNNGKSITIQTGGSIAINDIPIGGVGGNVRDYSANNNEGQAVGTTVVAGKSATYGTARSFNGSSDYIEVPNNSSLQLTTAYTFSTWVYRSADNGTWERILSKSGTAGGYDYWMQIQPDDTLNCGVYKTDSAYNRSSSATVPTGQWTHVSCSFDSTNGFNMYINGSLSNGTVAGTIGVARTSTSNFEIGRLGSGSWYYSFNGNIDDVRIYNYARSVDQITEDMNYAANPTGSIPIAWYRFEDGGQIKETNLWSQDADGDGWTQTLETQDKAQTDSPGTGWVRRNTIIGSAFGTGIDGPATTAFTSANLNTYTSSGRTCADAINYNAASFGSTTLSSNMGSPTVTTATIGSNVSGCLAAGDNVIVINEQGTASNNTNVGNWEMLKIYSVSAGASSTITFTSAKKKCYGEGGTWPSCTDGNIGTAGTYQRVMIQRLPQYQNVTISGTLNATAWNGQKGGVVAFQATGTVTNSGTINTTSLGYGGGAGGAGTGSNGESYDGYVGTGGTGSAAGTSGGGCSSNGSYTNCSSSSATRSGGGGGGLVPNGTSGTSGGAGGGGGNGNGGGGGGGGGQHGNSTSNVLGGAGGGSGTNGGGGGGGGSGTDKAGGAGGTNSAGSAGTSGGSGGAIGSGAVTGTGGNPGSGGGGGGGGGYCGVSDISSKNGKIFLGGGGGGGAHASRYDNCNGYWVDDSNGGAGGAGGGIIMIFANTYSVSGSGTIISNGTAGGGLAGCISSGGGGNGGGGAGGSILVYGSTVTLGSSSTASGLGGGANGTASGIGGTGGVGRIAVGYATLAGTNTTTPTYTTITAP